MQWLALNQKVWCFPKSSEEHKGPCGGASQLRPTLWSLQLWPPTEALWENSWASCTHPARTQRGGPDARGRSRGNWAPLWFQVTSDYWAGLCSPKWSRSPPPTVWWPSEGPHCDSSCKPAAVSTPASFRSKLGNSGEALLNPSSGCRRRPLGTAVAYNMLPSRACLWTSCCSRGSE